MLGVITVLWLYESFLILMKSILKYLKVHLVILKWFGKNTMDVHMREGGGEWKERGMGGGDRSWQRV